MKKVVLSCLLIGLLAFSSSDSRDSYAVTRVKQDYHTSFENFTKQLDLYISVLSQESSLNEIRKAHLETREIYKTFEYLIAHFDNPSVKQHFNGAPLPVVQFEKGNVVVVDPVGLQVLDELVFSDQMDINEVKDLIGLMRQTVDKINHFESNRYIDESHILRAMREQLIRIVSLGLSGYDTPGSLHAIKEAEVSLSQMLISFKYFSVFVDDDNDTIFKEVVSAFEKCISFLKKEKNFDSLDRLLFIKEYLNPLSALLLVFHDISKIPFLHEEYAQENGLNEKALHMFDPNLFNSYAYAGFKVNQDNDALRQLGATLFYDEYLSLDGAMSCATCHDPKHAFTDNRQLSISNHITESTQRNTPSLINSIYSQRYFYDLRAQKLDEQIIQVFSNPNEFHADFDIISDKLTQSPGYKTMFSNAFPNSDNKESIISRSRIITAMSSYVNSIRSLNSEFDLYMRGEIDAVKKSVKQGFNLFMGKAACGTCHFAPLFSGLVPPDFDENETEILGVPISVIDNTLDDDIGRIGNGWKHELADHYQYSFKTVTVRNVEKTAPYMHNGIYDTLEEVLDFYNHGGGAGMGIDVPNQTLSPDSLHLNKIEMQQIIDFMISLTDVDFDYIVPDTLPRFNNSEGELLDIRRNIYSR